MKSAILTLVVAAAVGGLVTSAHAQEKLKAAATPMVGDHKEMPLAGSSEARTAVAPVVKSGEMARIGRPSVETGVAQPNSLTEAKAQRE